MSLRPSVKALFLVYNFHHPLKIASCRIPPAVKSFPKNLCLEKHDFRMFRESAEGIVCQLKRIIDFAGPFA
jgi:hypothetical protein